MPEVVIFDLDGTLVRTMEGFADVAGDIIARRPGWTVERAKREYFATSGVPFIEQLETLFPFHPENGRAAAEYERRKLDCFYEVPIEDDVLAAVGILRAAGMRLAVSSNNFEHLVRDKIRSEAPGSFDVVFGFRAHFAKGPRHFAAIRERFAVRADQCLFVGDSLADQTKAAVAGMDFVGVVGTVPRSRFVARCSSARTVKSIADLPALLGISRWTADRVVPEGCGRRTQSW